MFPQIISKKRIKLKNYIFLKLFFFERNENFFKTYVKPPNPIVVKKLIANLVFLGSSLGNRPENASNRVLKIKTGL